MILLLTTLLTHFQFEHLGPLIKRFESSLDDLITQRQREIAEQKEHWREKITQLRKQHSAFYIELDDALDSGEITSIETGSGSAYLLKNADGNPCFVIKPCDEAALCLHNPKNFGSPFNEGAYRVRTHIPLYRSAQTEALAYSVACELGLQFLTPETYLAIISTPLFYGTEKEKLCSVQRYISHKETLAQHPLEIDPERIQELMLFIWCIGDTDAHLNNFPILDNGSIIKIDNGLSFPDVNSHLCNTPFFLLYCSQLSLTQLAFHFTFRAERIVEKMYFFELESAADAFQERIAIFREYF